MKVWACKVLKMTFSKLNIWLAYSSQIMMKWHNLLRELSLELGHHLEQIDDFMQDPDAMKHILRDSF